MTSEEENWRKGFEKVGAETLRLKIATSNVTLADPYLRCAHEWILEKEVENAAEERRRFHKTLGWTIVGAFAAIIAAAASLVAVIR
jgi:hypothetical protein